MTGRASDPYAVLGVSPRVTDAELRAAYRRAVQRHHPDHNGGSPESARRFEEVQDAYARIRELRVSGRAGGRGPGSSAGRGSGSSAGRTDHGASDSGLDSRLADMERELAAARDRARRAAREAADSLSGVGGRSRPSDEDLGYVTTDDSFAKIFTDAATGLSEHLAQARQPGSGPAAARGAAGRAAHKLADVIDDLGDKLTGE
ncbi:MAG TPA: J domain-containing protein [Solirubrobacteraceae bacterium]